MSTSRPRIDSHQHFWLYSSEEYGWISDDMSVLRRDYLPAELGRIVSQANIDGVISVQARQTLDETRWLLELASENEFICGVVGWVPLASPRPEWHLEDFAATGKLKGVRHFVQSEPDDAFLDREDFNRGVSALRQHGVVFDILVAERQMASVPRFVDRHPGQWFVLDHLGKPRIKDGVIEPWRRNIIELARRPNVACKLSGMVTEADLGAWRPEHLQPYVDVALEAFRPERLMFGSDWPVALLATSYERWQETLTHLVGALSAEEQDWIWGRTAARVYGLDMGVSRSEAV